VKLAFIDDRKSKRLVDQREMELRKARAASQSKPIAAPVADIGSMPGPGYTLSGDVIEDGAHNDDAEESLQPSVPGALPQMPGPGHVLGDSNDTNVS
jgi:hypothetical protein